LHGSRSKQCGAAIAAVPLPASSTTLNGLMIVGSMKDITWFTYGSRTLRFVTSPRFLAGAGRSPPITMSRMSLMPASPLSGNAPSRTSFMPLYCLGLCDAVICAPPE
jgi:hypothetical protein